MVEQVRRLDAQYDLHLTEDEIRRIAEEAEESAQVLRCLYEVELGQTRPIMGVVKSPRARATKRVRK